jgi:hypothetical protein
LNCQGQCSRLKLVLQVIQRRAKFKDRNFGSASQLRAAISGSRAMIHVKRSDKWSTRLFQRPFLRLFRRNLIALNRLNNADHVTMEGIVRQPNEREQLAALTRKGRGPAQRLMKAWILLKADASEAGEGWSDSQIIEALETSASVVYRVRTAG